MRWVTKEEWAAKPKPGRGCLTCPLKTCHGCVGVMPTREETEMLKGITPEKKKRPDSGNCSERITKDQLLELSYYIRREM